MCISCSRFHKKLLEIPATKNHKKLGVKKIFQRGSGLNPVWVPKSLPTDSWTYEHDWTCHSMNLPALFGSPRLGSSVSDLLLWLVAQAERCPVPGGWCLMSDAGRVPWHHWKDLVFDQVRFFWYNVESGILFINTVIFNVSLGVIVSKNCGLHSLKTQCVDGKRELQIRPQETEWAAKLVLDDST